MPKHKESHSQEVEDESRRKKSPRQHEGKVMKAPGEELASHGPTVEDPVALLTSPQIGHPANAPLRAQAMAELQRRRGNIYVQRLLRSGAIQANLAVGQPGEGYQQEANRVVEAETHMPAPELQRQPLEQEEPLPYFGYEEKQAPPDYPSIVKSVAAALAGAGRGEYQFTKDFRTVTKATRGQEVRYAGWLVTKDGFTVYIRFHH